MLQQALEAVERKDYAKAKAILEPICKVSEKRCRAWTLLSLVFLQMNEPMKAFEASRVGAKRGTFVLAEYVMTRSMYALGMNENKCLEQLERTMSIDTDCLYTVKLASCLPKESDGAILLEKKALELNTTSEKCIKMFYRAGQMFSKLSRKEDALRNFREVTTRCENITSLTELRDIATYKVAALSGSTDKKEIARAPESYIKKLYNSFASTFDETLVKKLAYKTPSEIRSLLSKTLEGKKTLGRCCDLGCGTGLSGVALRKFANYLVGVDLSESMVELARKREIYEELYVSEIVNFLKDCSTCFDLIVSCDVFVYLGDLENVFKAAASALSSNGMFLFSTEQQIGCDTATTNKCEKPYVLDTTKRFKHCTEYILGLSEKHGFSVIECIRGRVIRKQGGSDVKGDIFLLEFTDD
jgi:predicted TPR repeat methyltransferase